MKSLLKGARVRDERGEVRERGGIDRRETV